MPGCGPSAAARVFALKGVERGSALVGLPTAVDVTLAGKRLRRGAKVRTVAGGLAKLELFHHLASGGSRRRRGPPARLRPSAQGRRRVPQAAVRRAAGHPPRPARLRQREWQKMRERNEALDCYVYARAAAAVLGLDRMADGHWRRREQALGIEPAVRRREVAEPPAAAPTAAEPARGERRAVDPWHRDKEREINPYTGRPAGDWLGRRGRNFWR